MSTEGPLGTCATIWKVRVSIMRITPARHWTERSGFGKSRFPSYILLHLVS